MNRDGENIDDLSVYYGEAKEIGSEKELYTLIENSGFMRSPKENELEKLSWDMSMVTRLYREFKQGLHKFITVRHGSGKESIVESRQKTVFADITCLIDGKEKKLKQYTQTITKYLDESQRIEESPVVPKTGTSSVSNRLPADAQIDPLEAIKATILKEIGLTADQYELIGEPKEEVIDQLSGGYPNLAVHLTATRYTIRLIKGSLDEIVKEDNPIPATNTLVTKRHIFRWEDAVERG